MANKGYTIENETITIDRELTELDVFLRDFLDILKKYSDYLVVSGFVSISTGRTRGTEDIDILVPEMDISKFNKLFDEIIAKDFWCYQGDTGNGVYDYIKNLNNVRFAKKGEMFPNIEFVPINETKRAKWCEFSNPLNIKIGDFKFKIPPIEFEILYKEIILTGKKDIEDARHLRTFFSDLLSEDKFKKYEPIIRGELK